jgi:hypothetical protein
MERRASAPFVSLSFHAVRLMRRLACLFGKHHYVKVIDKADLTAMTLTQKGIGWEGIIRNSHRGCEYCGRAEVTEARVSRL